MKKYTLITLSIILTCFCTPLYGQIDIGTEELKDDIYELIESDVEGEALAVIERHRAFFRSDINDVKVQGSARTVGPPVGVSPNFAPQDGWFNVKEMPYNAAGDGITDDRTVIQSALDDAAEYGGGVVYFPPGTYSISTCLRLHSSSTAIRGSGIGVSVIKAANDFDGGDGAMFWVEAENAVDGLDNIEISNLSLNGNMDNVGGGGVCYRGFRIKHLSGLKLYRCEISNVKGTGIYLDGYNGPNKDIKLIGNSITNVGQAGIIGEYLVSFLFENNRVVSTGWMGMIFTGALNDPATEVSYSRKGHILNNYVNRSRAPSIICTNTGYQKGFLMGIGGGSEDLLIAGNILWDNSVTNQDGLGWGLPAGAKIWKRIVISGNIIGKAGAFGIDPLSDCVVKNNLVYEPGQVGIAVAGDFDRPVYDSITIDGNIIIGGVYSGIHFNSWNNVPLENLVISNNYVRTPGHGIRLWGKGPIGNLKISGNDLEDVGGYSVSWENNNIENLSFNDNTTKLPYKGEIQLSDTPYFPGGKWISFSHGPKNDKAKFRIRRTDGNKSAAIGYLRWRFYESASALKIESVDSDNNINNGPPDTSKVYWEFLGIHN